MFNVFLTKSTEENFKNYVISKRDFSNYYNLNNYNNENETINNNEIINNDTNNSDNNINKLNNIMYNDIDNIDNTDNFDNFNTIIDYSYNNTYNNKNIYSLNNNNKYNNYNKLNKQQLYYFKENFKIYKIQLKQLTLLEINDKLYFDNQENICIDKYDNLQFFRRWYNNQHRDSYYKLLNKKIMKYIFYLTDINEILLYNNNHNNNIEEFIQLCIGIINFNHTINQGLQNLIMTYKDDIKLVQFLNKLKYQITIKNNYIENNELIMLYKDKT